MSLHRLTSVEIGVPNVRETSDYYREFGLSEISPGNFATVSGGEQLKLVYAPARTLLEIGIGADNPDDLERIAHQLNRMDVPFQSTENTLRTGDPGSHVRVRIEVVPRLVQPPEAPIPFNAPGRKARTGRAPGVLKPLGAKPRRLGHVVYGSANYATTKKFYLEGLGFKLSDTMAGDRASFMRCSIDHHNVLALDTPVPFLHHTSWEVGDIDEIGRGAEAMLENHPERHVWGFGRHHAGSNFFWYLRDPAGNFSEYFADLDQISEDEIWIPGIHEGARGLYNWGPKPPKVFMAPDDIAGLREW